MRRVLVGAWRLIGEIMERGWMAGPGEGRAEGEGSGNEEHEIEAEYELK